MSVPTINEHVKNIYKEAELAAATIRKFRIVQKEGQRTIFRDGDEIAPKLSSYPLDRLTAHQMHIKLPETGEEAALETESGSWNGFPDERHRSGLREPSVRNPATGEE